MNRLIRGVHQFYRDVYTPRRDDYQRSLDRQEPEALFVTCSDSRLDPQAHTQAGPGELFVLRNADLIHAEHEAILQACKSGNAEKARQLAKEHIRHTQNGLHQQLSSDVLTQTVQSALSSNGDDAS
jgi:DNA-binding GntR family transcriptional regulator